MAHACRFVCSLARAIVVVVVVVIVIVVVVCLCGVIEAN